MYLNCKSFFSLRYGTMHVDTLIRQASAMGITTLALTNINITSDAWTFVNACREHDIKPILGLECRNEHVLSYLLLAKNQNGWYHINAFLSEKLHTDDPFPETAPALPDVYVIYPWGTRDPLILAANELMGVSVKNINRLFRVDTLAIKNKLVIMQPVTFQDDLHYELHQILRAVDQNILISQLQSHTTASPDEKFIHPAQLISHFEQYPHIVENTLKIMESCNVEMAMGIPRNKKTFTGDVQQDQQLLRDLAYKGMCYRYGSTNDEAAARIEKELKVIAQLNFESYFLITWDIVSYAQRQGFFYVGRGSGANSIVAYCLKITDVDPIELDLYFERFLNQHRSSPPDFDIDFSWKDRDQITQYIFDKYGKEHTALLGTVTTFQTHAMIRELGKAYGLPKKEIDRILRGGFSIQLDEDRIQRKILHFCQLMENQGKAFPNHLSIHAGGVLISDEPIHHFCTTYFPPKGFSTAQLDMFQAEDIGLYKFDILSQRGLGHIRDAIDLIKANHGEDVDIHNVKAFMVDEKVKANLRAVNTIGCFYIESPAMRQLLTKLRCDNYLSLVAASSIIRPGVAQSGMMKQYIDRYNNPKNVVYLHPIIEELLHETFGIMVYQEDVIKVAHKFADMELADADMLRRAMAGKYRGLRDLEKIQERFFNNCERLGRPRDVSEEIWRQIASFANYSFSKAHSASFAVESYQSLYLKTYYPAEFMVAVINNFGGFYSRELYFTQLKLTGITLHAPCINHSDYLTNIKNMDVHVGLIHIEGLEQGLAERILNERAQYGLFADLDDFVSRIGPGPEQLELLIRIGCFNFTGSTKKELFWKGSLLVKSKEVKNIHHMPLFKPAPVDCTLPSLAYHAHEDAFDEIDLLGFPLQSPFKVLQHNQDSYIHARDFHKFVGKEVLVLGYYVTMKMLRTSKGEPMCFGTFLDADDAFVDTVHFPDSLRRYPFQKGGFYILQGKVVDDYQVITLEISKMRKIGYFEDQPIS
ncbi:DNA polymerase III subunit alpha [Chitinophaga sp. Cy-1792]|uniref:DNA polymerase III subunit alpha n=1 Tax=Chitinophaga sp. Cy-1792 TaxID=2608339 RepID=UPI0014215E49|nr:DNA polymerase III subunit alpha [Chitinophaga sp. Cy-1792]NIG57077.1 DNA polymerase III subunit alpha [Chitinophaga sp. Cy-1792]